MAFQTDIQERHFCASNLEHRVLQNRLLPATAQNLRRMAKWLTPAAAAQVAAWRQVARKEPINSIW
jgi:hypothetical protein